MCVSRVRGVRGVDFHEKMRKEKNNGKIIQKNQKSLNNYLENAKNNRELKQKNEKMVKAET